MQEKIILKDAIEKIKSSNLKGKGGANFPTGQKWESVLDAKGDKKYVVCNGSEGEPGVKKDAYILENYPEQLIKGINLAMDSVHAKEGIIYLNQNYYKKFNSILRKIIKDLPISVFMKPVNAGYVGGVETVVLNVIENKRFEPRLRPPFPVSKGLYGFPTIVNNVETLYDAALVNEGKYSGDKFFTINGAKYNGVFPLHEDLTIMEILNLTENVPEKDFFVQVGGDASGQILNQNQLNQKVAGVGCITIHEISSHDPMKLMNYWMDFFQKESCGQCTPCREGTYRIKEILHSKNPDWKILISLLQNMKETSFCGLGSSVCIPFFSYFKNVVSVLPKNKINSIKNSSVLLKAISEASFNG